MENTFFKNCLQINLQTCLPFDVKEWENQEQSIPRTGS